MLAQPTRQRLFVALSELAAGVTAPAEQAIGDLLAAPRITTGALGRLSCELDNCPHRDAAKENQDVICTLHTECRSAVVADCPPAGARSSSRAVISAGCWIGDDAEVSEAPIVGPAPGRDAYLGPVGRARSQ